nr:hypothetical protein [uncultured Schaedlerella sp.]
MTEGGAWRKNISSAAGNKKNIRTEEGQEETRYNFIYKGELAVVITEKQNYCDYSYFLTSDKISVSELMQKVVEVERIE